MALRIKSADQVANKYAARAGAAGPDYQAGVQNPRRDWAQATSAAKDTWAAGVQAAAANGSFAKGVTHAGSDKWTRKAAGVGSQRYGAGVQAAKGDYQAGVQPYLDTLSNLTLPPRMPKGDPQNVQRVAAVAAALRSKKLGK